MVNDTHTKRRRPSRLHIVISFLTHADHVFLGLPRFLVPGTPNRVMELMQEMARCTYPYHLRRRVRRTAVISSTLGVHRISGSGRISGKFCGSGRIQKLWIRLRSGSGRIQNVWGSGWDPDPAESKISGSGSSRILLKHHKH